MEQSVLDIFSLFEKKKGTTVSVNVEGTDFDLSLEPLNNLDMIKLDDMSSNDAERVFYAGLLGIAEGDEKLSVKYAETWDDVVSLYTDRVPYATTRSLGETVLALTDGTFEADTGTQADLTTSY